MTKQGTDGHYLFICSTSDSFTKHESGNPNNAPLKTKALDCEYDSDNII